MAGRRPATMGGKHRAANASTGGRQVDGSGTPLEDGRSVARMAQHRDGRLVMDSPPYVPPVVVRCGAVRTDGQVCTNEVHNAGERCFGHKAGRGGRG